MMTIIGRSWQTPFETWVKKREEDDSLVTDLEKRINDRQSTREAQKQDRIDKENAKIAAEKEAKEAKEAAEIAKKEQEAAKKADILSGESCFLVIPLNLQKYHGYFGRS